ncbi:MAG: transposase zinc-binding domain-containing protein [Xanthomonadales bacterium]|nr:transposase zinc-binding domain-containing protein [Xanthomonadales bacterium]
MRQEFEEYLKCGRLEHGFLRVKCGGCRHEHLIAFSCKLRGERESFSCEVNLGSNYTGHVEYRRFYLFCFQIEISVFNPGFSFGVQHPGQICSTRSTVIPAQAGIQEFQSNPRLGESSGVVGTGFPLARK